MNPLFVPVASTRGLRSTPACTKPTDYADVDHTERQFTAFQNDFQGGDGVLTDGAAGGGDGPYGSGKTALVNRCVKWLANAAGERHPVVVDLRRDRLDRGEVADRIKFIAGRLVDELTQPPAAEFAGDLAQRLEEPDRMFPILSQVLGPSTFLVVLLPPSGDLVSELIKYARFARAKLLFFAETAYWSSLRERRAEFHSAGGSPPCSWSSARWPKATR